MTSTMRTYFAATVTKEGRSDAMGSLHAPIGEASVGDGRTDADFTVGKGGGELVAFIRGNLTRFDLLALRLRGTTGRVWVAVQWRLADANGEPTGDPRWFHVELPCKAVFVLYTEKIRAHADVTKWWGDAADRPQLWDSTPVEALITKVMVRNPDDEDVVLQRMLVG